MEALVTTEWLANEMGASDLRIVDATKFLTGQGRDAAAEYEAGHIQGAVFMDLAELTDTASPYDNMLPPAAKFASRMQSLGLGDGSRIVLYDDSPLKSSTRAWWMLTLFGAHDVAILDGGIAKWKAEGRPLATGRKRFAIAISLSGRTIKMSGPKRICWLIFTARQSRSPMRGPRRASQVRRVILAGWLMATSPDRSACRTAPCSTPMAPGSAMRI